MNKEKKLFWRFQGNENKYVNQIFKKGFKFKTAPYSEKLEKKWSSFHKLKYSICINSCTSALHIAFRSLGIKEGDEVIVPALTPIMCGTTVHFCNATPVYADVNYENFLISINDVKKKITSKTKAILAVHMYSGICDLRELKKICREKKIYLVEDCAEAVGAKDKNGNLAGTVGDISCWSFQSAKQLTSGDGGILSTNNKVLGKRIRQFSNLGFKTLTAKSNQIIISKDKRQNPNYSRFTEIGFNYRMNEFSAAIALAQLERIKLFIKLRRMAGNAFEKLLAGNKYLVPQRINKKEYSTYYTFAANLKIKNKKKLNWEKFRKKFMKYGGDGIYAASKLLHQEPAVRKYKIGKCYKSCKKNCVINCYGTPVAKKLQKNLLLFTTNQSNNIEIYKQIKALKKTLTYFQIK
jgi:perosamine synthetase